jgi:hypothetical protein
MQGLLHFLGESGSREDIQMGKLAAPHALEAELKSS